MTFGQFFAILYARRWAALLVLVLVVGTTLALSLILPKQYTAVASVVVDPKPDAVSAMMYPGVANPAYMATQVDIIQSDRVAQRVVRNLKLNENPQLRQQWQEEADGAGTFEAWLADVLQKKMDVKPSRESNVISISYKAPNPAFAAGLANAFVKSYIDTSLELRVDPAKQFSSFFDTRGKEARDALEKAQNKLSAYQKDKGIIATDDRLDVETGRLNELSSQLVMLQSLSAEAGSRQSQARAGSGESMQEVLNSPVVVQMRVEIAHAEAQLKDLSSRLGDNNPQVTSAKASLAELRSRLESEVRRATSGVSVSNNITQARLNEIQAQVETQRAKVLRMKAIRDESALMFRDVENAQRTYDAVLARLSQTSLESQTTQSSVNILTQATPPIEPSFPKLFINTALAIFVGGLLAVGVALLLEFLDRRVRSIQDLPALLGLPVIGIMPKPTSSRKGASRPISLMQQRVMGQLPSITKSA